MGIISSFPLCTRNIICFLLDCPSSLQSCKLCVCVFFPSLFVCNSFFYCFFAVPTFLLCDISYYPSFWPSKKGWWSMSVQVSKYKFLCYLYYSLSWTCNHALKIVLLELSNTMREEYIYIYIYIWWFDWCAPYFMLMLYGWERNSNVMNCRDSKPFIFLDVTTPWFANASNKDSFEILSTNCFT